MIEGIARNTSEWFESQCRAIGNTQKIIDVLETLNIFNDKSVMMAAHYIKIDVHRVIGIQPSEAQGMALLRFLLVKRMKTAGLSESLSGGMPVPVVIPHHVQLFFNGNEVSRIIFSDGHGTSDQSFMSNRPATFVA